MSKVTTGFLGFGLLAVSTAALGAGNSPATYSAEDAATAKAILSELMLPVDTQQQTQAALQQVLADPALKLTVTRAAMLSPESPPTAALMAIYDRVVDSMWPGLTVMPSMDAGASDSKYTRAAGIPSYGAASIFIDLEDMRARGQNLPIG